MRRVTLTSPYSTAATNLQFRSGCSRDRELAVDEFVARGCDIDIQQKYPLFGQSSLASQMVANLIGALTS